MHISDKINDSLFRTVQLRQSNQLADQIRPNNLSAYFQYIVKPSDNYSDLPDRIESYYHIKLVP